MKFECPYCEAHIQFPEKRNNNKASCPTCKKELIIPEPHESTIEVTPKVDYPKVSIFGGRIRDEESYEKKKVAHFVVRHFLTQGASAFICDGSSTFFVGLKIFQEAQRRSINSELPLDVTIYTNNLAIAHEYALWNSPQGKLPAIKVYFTGGDICTDLMMGAGDQAKDMAAKTTQYGPYLVLAVRAILAREGPIGLKNSQDVIIKQAVLKAGEGIVQGVIFIADHEKLSKKYEVGMPKLFNNTADWENLMKKTNTFIVSTRNANYEGKPLPQGVRFNKPQEPEECYLVNSYLLALQMNERFILL